MRCEINVPITGKTKCKEGFYLIINGTRVRVRSKAEALIGLQAWLKMQRVQIVTVRQYAERNRRRIEQEMPKP